MERRDFFFQTALAGSILFSIPGRAEYAQPVRLHQEPFQTLHRVYLDLFPSSLSMPGPDQLNTVGYLQAVLADQRISESRREYIRNGAGWLDDFAHEFGGKKYLNLDDHARRECLREVSEYRWGEAWLGFLITFYFESMCCDPVYGGNDGMSGWQWLGHTSGLPRPTEVPS